MADVNESGIKTFTAGGALAAYRRVKLSAGSGTQVVYADAGEDHIGVTKDSAASGGVVAVALKSKPGTVKVTAADSFAAGAELYGAADGKVSDTVAGAKLGRAGAAASGDASVVELIPQDLPLAGGLKVGHFEGVAAAGPCTLTGAAVGDRVLGGFKSGDASDNLTSGEGAVTTRDAFVALFEGTITVADQIQQASASNLSDNKYTVFLLPAGQ
jgi:hypothetical protein